MDEDLWVIEVGSAVVGIVRGADKALQAASDFMDDYEGNATEAFVDGPYTLDRLPCYPRIGHLVRRRD